MANLQAPPSINDARTQALLKLIGRLDGLDLTPILTNRIDSVLDAALIFLTWQWDMLSPEWQLISGGVDIRSLLKAAIPLHSVLGTPAALKQALAALGWTNVTILEGQSSWGGTSWPSNEGWAVFRVLIQLPPGTPVTNAVIQQIKSAANFFKPERCWLDAVVFSLGELGPDFPPLPIDAFSYQGTGIVSEMAPVPTESIGLDLGEYRECYPSIAARHDTHYNRGGGITYGAVPDGGEIILADGPLVITAATGYPSRIGAWVESADGIARCVLPPSRGGIWGPGHDIPPANLLGGELSIPSLAETYAVSQLVPVTVIALSTNWNTTIWTDAESGSGFTIAFGTPAPAGALVDWWLPLGETTLTYQQGATAAISSGAESATISLPVNAPNASYLLTLKPNWNTTVWWEPGSKTTSQFVVNFGTPAPAGASLDWSAVIP